MSNTTIGIQHGKETVSKPDMRALLQGGGQGPSSSFFLRTAAKHQGVEAFNVVGYGLRLGVGVLGFPVGQQLSERARPLGHAKPRKGHTKRPN